MIDSTYQILKKFKPVSLKEMDSVALMKRTDTKYLVPISKINDLLESLKEDYHALTINGDNIMSYQSEYYDTPDKSFYFDHHNGKSRRTKVRVRNYVESDLYFLEIKQKDGKGQTNKSRIKLNGFEPNLSESSKAFINEVTSNNYSLVPTLINSFNRITLVNFKFKERVTIDLNLAFTDTDNKKSFSKLAIIELKQERFNRDSPIVKALRNIGIHPYSVSKYCIGMLSLNPDLKHNAFKKKIRQINKVINA